MDPSAMESIAGRLSAVEGLYFPRSVELTAPPPSHRKTLLLDLLCRDPSLFLERYGSHLTADELFPFEALTTDYSVKFHLSRLQSLLNPTLEDRKSRSFTVKNRRRAYLEKLVQGGEYFSEEAMREREPYLHYDILGRFQDPMGRVMSRPGERWSETLLRRCEEAEITEKIRGEQKRRGVDRREWIGGGDEMEEVESEEEEEEEEESEEESEEEEEDGLKSKEEREDKESDGRPMVTAAKHFEPSISAEEMQDQLDHFTHIMQEKFLAGEDTEHVDYSKIDDDERLDDHWFKEACQDAEEKYFDED